MSDEQKPKAGRGMDPEIQAMARCDRVLAEVDEAARRRIVVWLMGRHCGLEHNHRCGNIEQSQP